MGAHRGSSAAGTLPSLLPRTTSRPPLLHYCFVINSLRSSPSFPILYWADQEEEEKMEPPMLDPISMFPIIIIIINHLPPLSEYNGIVAPPLPFHTSSLYFRALASSPVHGPCLFGAGGLLFGVGAAAAAAARRAARRMATLLIGLFPCRLRSCLTISRRYMYFFFFLWSYSSIYTWWVVYVVVVYTLW